MPLNLSRPRAAPRLGQKTREQILAESRVRFPRSSIAFGLRQEAVETASELDYRKLKIAEYLAAHQQERPQPLLGSSEDVPVNYVPFDDRDVQGCVESMKTGLNWERDARGGHKTHRLPQTRMKYERDKQAFRFYFYGSDLPDLGGGALGITLSVTEEEIAAASSGFRSFGEGSEEIVRNVLRAGYFHMAQVDLRNGAQRLTPRPRSIKPVTF
jgi:hypothetical protein